MTVVLIGNAIPRMADGSPAQHIIDDPCDGTITRVDVRPGFDDREESELALSTPNDPMLRLIGLHLTDDDRRYAIGVREVDQLWFGNHSGDEPEWVESDDADFARVLAAHFQCRVGRPDGWTSWTDVPEAPPRIEGGGLGTSFAPSEFDLDYQLAWREHYLLTNAGRDALHAQHMSTSAQPASFNYGALTANVTAPSTGSTTLPGEITTASGGLVRKQMTYAHTGGTNTSTLTATWTANGSDSLPVTVHKLGVLNATSAGTLGYETVLSADATLTASGDNVTVTDTVTAG